MTNESTKLMFHGIAAAPQPLITRALAEYRADNDPKKVDLLFGNYQDENGKTSPMAVAKLAERALDNLDDYTYLPVAGLKAFTVPMAQLIVGEFDTQKTRGGLHIAAVQTVSGTFGLYLAARLLVQRGPAVIYMSKPTWGHHRGVLVEGGMTEFRDYRYCNFQDKCLDFAGMMADLKDAPARSTILLQPCGHNPTGVNPTTQQWEEILQVIKNNKQFPFWDSAFHGLASGDLDIDAWPVRRCVELGIEFICVQTTAKNFRLDNHRSGNLVVGSKSREQLDAVVSLATRIANDIYNNPPGHGARIVIEILRSPQLAAQWKEEVREMADRMKAMRALLRKNLEDLGTPGSWNHITDQAGLFMFSGLNADQALYIRKHHHVYILESGRMNVCGINHNNVKHIASAIFDAVTRFEQKA